jgi:hypothetical protein
MVYCVFVIGRQSLLDLGKELHELFEAESTFIFNLSVS